MWSYVTCWLHRLFRRERRPLELTFYTRRGCHLCDEARHMLARYEDIYDLKITVIDIDLDTALAARFGETVPVIAVEGRPRLWGRVNDVLLRRLLRAEAPRKR